MSLSGNGDKSERRAAEDGRAALLVQRIKGGESELFAELYELYFDGIYRYLRVMVRDDHLAEDLAQQVFVQVLQSLDGYERRSTPFRAWLFRIARNAAISHLRKEGRVEVLDPARIELRPIDGERDGAAASPAWLSDQELLAFVERLPVAQRQVLALRFMLDMSTAEAAEALDLSPENVRVLQHRALRFLEQRLSAVRGPQRANREAPALRWRRQASVLRHRRFALVR